MFFHPSRKAALWIRFFAYSIGTFLVLSAYYSLINLQSSINIVDNIGTRTTAVLYGSGVVTALTLVPILLRRFGPRICLSTAVISYILFTTANFYPVIQTLIPASILVGISDAMMWTCMPVLLSFFAVEYEKIVQTGKKHVSTFAGYFFGILQSGKIFGNMVTYAVLQSFCGDTCSGNTSTSFNTQNITHCGANDCQDQSAIRDSIDKYVPDQIAVYILLGAMIVMQIIGVVLYLVFLPHRVHSGESGQATDQHISIGKELKYAINTFKETMRQMVAVKQLLLTPGVIYSGLAQAFLISEMTRSFTSCIFGVSWVPIHTAIFGLSASIISVVSGILTQYIPLLSLFIFAGLVDAATYIYYFLWTPSNATQWAVIPAYIFVGGMIGIWTSQSQASQASVYQQKLDVGSSVWNFWNMFSMSVLFAVSPLICVDVKIIVYLAVLIITIFSYVALEFVKRREKEKPASDVSI